jgi:asparagine synthase (glutamine-hydrolysing)
VKKFIGWIHKGSEFTLHSSPAPVVVDGIRALFRGFLADRKELTINLQPSRLPNGRSADPQLLAVAYRCWGRGFQSRVFGEFAYALFDAHQRELLLGHDALGLLPLFYADTPRIFAFSTHLEELVALTGIGSIDEEYIADCFALTTHFGERTPYGHIRRLVPGQGLIVGDGSRPQTFQIYDPAGVVTLNFQNRSAYLEQCRWLISKAVESAVPSTGNVWSELSGGMDSSTVVSVAARLPESAIEALSIVFSRLQTADETDWIEVVQKKTPNSTA